MSSMLLLAIHCPVNQLLQVFFIIRVETKLCGTVGFHEQG